MTTQIKEILSVFVSPMASHSEWLKKNLPGITPGPFSKPYPNSKIEDETPVEKVQLTTLEKIYFLEKEIHRLRQVFISNYKKQRGRLTKEETFLFCLYKKELESLRGNCTLDI
jgi:hypothetical protein